MDKKYQNKYGYKLIAIMLIVAIFFIGLTEVSFAETKIPVKIRYAKEQVFYSDTGLSQKMHSYVKGVYGKNEKIKTQDIGYFDDKAYCRLKECIRAGDSLWIQRSLTTTKKPKYTYTVTRLHRTLRLKAQTKLRIEPRSKAKYFRCRDTNVITLGKTNNGWYKVFVNGKVGFIKKGSSQIKSDKKADFIPLKFDNFHQDVRSELISCISYFYAMMPERAREKLKDRGTVVTISEKFEIEWLEKGPYAGYTTGEGQIYLKDTSNLENIFLHESGHVLTVNLLENKKTRNRVKKYCFPEASKLPFDTYHKKDTREYLAEAFAYYVLMPQRLQKNAPNTYDFFQDILGY